MKFSEIKGQEALKRHFKNALRRKEFSAAYLIEGEPLSGKKTMAEAFVSAMMCERGGEEACGVCHSCRMAKTRNHPDIVWPVHEKPNLYSVDEVREQIVEDAWLKPFYGGRKAYIVDEAEKMAPASQNAILKTLEDPPDYVVIILLCASAEQFLPTVRSRCVKLKMAPLPDELIRAQLTRGFNMPEYEAKPILAFARGNLGKALSLAKDKSFGEMKEQTLDLLSHLQDRPLPLLFDQAEALEESFRDRMGELFDLFLLWYRDALVFKATGDKEELVFSQEGEAYAVSMTARRESYAKMVQNIRHVSRARRQIRENVSAVRALQQLVIELRQQESAVE